MKINMSIAGLNPANQSRIFEKAEVESSEIHIETKKSNYSGNIWRDGIRKANNFISADVLILDMDGTVSMEEMKNSFSNIKNVLIVTSKSHQKANKVTDDGSLGKIITPADYYHVIIVLEQPITDLDTYKKVMTNLISKYGADPACKDGARFFYGNPNQQHWYS